MSDEPKRPARPPEARIPKPPPPKPDPALVTYSERGTKKDAKRSPA